MCCTRFTPVYNFLFFYFLNWFVVGSAWSFSFFIPATTANDLRLRKVFYPRFYPLHYLLILILEKEPRRTDKSRTLKNTPKNCLQLRFEFKIEQDWTVLSSLSVVTWWQITKQEMKLITITLTVWHTEQNRRFISI